MTHAPGLQYGTALLVPCASVLSRAEQLVAEAEELWKAEHRGAGRRDLGADWGCVGVMFGPRVPDDWKELWSEVFRRQASAVSPVNGTGVLDIPWLVATDGTPVALDLDVVLATATKAEATWPDAGEVADAWIDQSAGHETYFFNNVLHGIRTAADVAIWSRFEERQPAWLAKPEYQGAVATLRREQRSC